MPGPISLITSALASDRDTSSASPPRDVNASSSNTLSRFMICLHSQLLYSWLVQKWMLKSSFPLWRTIDGGEIPAASGRGGCRRCEGRRQSSDCRAVDDQHRYGGRAGHGE